MEMYTLHFDGSCGPKNPGGTAAYGFVLSKDGVELDRGHGVIGSGPGMTNNLAEFHALDQGLRSFLLHWSGEHGVLNVYGDSNLVIQIMSRRWKASKDKLYYPAYLCACEALRDVRQSRKMAVHFEWVPREHNTICDGLSKAHQQK